MQFHQVILLCGMKRRRMGADAVPAYRRECTRASRKFTGSASAFARERKNEREREVRRDARDAARPARGAGRARLGGMAHAAARRANVLLRMVHPRLSIASAARDDRVHAPAGAG
ncbi:hypothetical protein [Burkholderia territorii]|uniref:hypothetical protein n=1 Tax=Burkholderia territorii TaxID=1503055 RepID=UPI0012D9409B|nr:hypothetical protein [Burkholderia territorii]